MSVHLRKSSPARSCCQELTRYGVSPRQATRPGKGPLVVEVLKSEQQILLTEDSKPGIKEGAPAATEARNRCITSPEEILLAMTDTQPTRKKYAAVKSILTLAIAITVLYFGKVEVQSYLGRKAVANTGFEAMSLEQALVAARADEKLVLADMSAIWCPSCRRLDKEVFGDPSVQQAIRAKYVFCRIEYLSTFRLLSA